MTSDGSFRVLVADTTETVRAIVEAQEVPPHSIEQMAAIVTSAVLIRETMTPGNRVQVIYNDAIGSQLVGDAFPEGKTRGLARILDEVLGVQTGEGASFRVERIIRAGTAHQGVIQTEAGEDLVMALRHYFLRSEQVVTMVDLGCVMRHGAVRHVAGYVVQLLPEISDPPLAAMEERLAQFGDLGRHLLANGVDPKRIMSAILADEDYTVLAESPVMFHCPCDVDRVRTAASTLGREEIQQLLVEEGDLKVCCDYCRKDYVLGVADFREMLDAK